MNTKTENTFTADEMNEIRAEARGVLETSKMTQSEGARESGLAYSTFSAFLNDTYTGNNDKPAGELQIWLKSRKEKARTVSAVPTAPEFLMTPSAAAIIDALAFAQAMPDITVIAGGAGIGKTKASAHYAATNPNVWHITMEPNTATVNTMLTEICEQMGIIERSTSRLSTAIRKKVLGTGGLLIVDEAQHLASVALDQLRSIHDRAGIGIALVGNETVYSRLEGEGRKSGFAQLFSRIGMRITQPKSRSGDLCMLLKAWGVENKDELKYLKAIGQKPGALRVMTKCLQVASLLAAGADEPRGLVHYKAAWERLTTSPFAA